MYALITGASSGIGREFAVLLARKKYDLIIAARRTDRLLELKRKLENKYHVNVIVKECDVSKQTNCIRLIEETMKYPVGILINNAGFGKVGKFENILLDDEIDMIHTNITAVHILTKLFVTERKKGYILNVASIAGFQPGPGLAVYSAAKAYVISYSLALNYELKKHKNSIHITTLCPGPVDTEFNHVANAEFNLRSISARACAREALSGMFRKKDIVIPGIGTKTLRIASRIAPLKLILPIEYWIQTKKLK